jgi:hypothetical protein
MSKILNKSAAGKPAAKKINLIYYEIRYFGYRRDSRRPGRR